MSKPLLIVGGDGHGSVIAACVEDNNKKFNDSEWEVHGFLNDNIHSTIDGYPVLGGLKDIKRFINKGYYISWGIHLIQRNPLSHKLFSELMIPKEKLATIIHNSAFIAENSIIEPGAFIMNNAYISPRVRLGKATMVKSNALIGHDVKCGELCHFAMGSITGAYSEIGICADVATGCVVLEHRKIGNYSFAGAASLISHDIPDYEIHVGNPARFLKNVRMD